MKTTSAQAIMTALSRIFGGKKDPTPEEIQKEVFTARTEMELAYRKAMQLEEQAQTVLQLDTAHPQLSVGNKPVDVISHSDNPPPSPPEREG